MGRPLILCGEGGAGKSQAAYYAVRSRGFYPVVWIEASNPILMQRDLRRAFHISMGRIQEIEELGNILMSAEGVENAAVIFDNVCDPDLLRRIIYISCNVQIIVTTPLTSAARGSGLPYVELRRWRPDGALPLARAVRAAYIRETGEEEGRQKRSEVEQSVAGVYAWLRGREINGMDPAYEASKQLQYSALLCGSFISVAVMEKLMKLRPGEVRKNMRVLERLELMRQNGRQANMCRTIQEAVRCCMGKAQVLDCIREILIQTEAVFGRVHLEPWKLHEGSEWRAHIDTLLTDRSWMTDSEDAIFMERKLGLLAGRYDLACGEYDSARLWLQKAKEGSWRRFPELCQEAMTELTRIMEIENDNDGVKDEIDVIMKEWPDLAKERPGLLADLLLIQSQSEENRGLYRRSKALLNEGLALLEETDNLTEEARNEKRVYLLNGLGKIYCSRHWYYRAIRIYDRAIALCDSEEEFRAAFLYGNKGNVFYHLGKYKKAEEYLIKQRQIYQNVYCDGPTCDELDNLNALITLYGRMNGKEAQIEECWRAAMRGIWEGGQKYRDAKIYLYNNYGAYQFRNNVLEKALELFNKGIRLCNAGNQKDNRLILILLLSNRAEVFSRKKEYAMALEDLRRAINISRRWKKQCLWLYVQYIHINIDALRFYKNSQKGGNPDNDKNVQ